MPREAVKKRALVIDDHLPSRSFLAQTLGERGFEVVGEGASGKAAAALAKATAPDAILMAEIARAIVVTEVVTKEKVV
jgi:DNA-binding NarL/FixJ family response regulator